MTDARPPSLTEIAAAHGTDKHGLHFYTPHYEAHLSHLRFEHMTLLEIGIGGGADPSTGGASLRMWREFFPHGTIVGLDIFDKSACAEDRIHVVRGSQADPQVLDDLGRAYGPFDVIVDDGSHLCRHVVHTFHGLFRYLKPGGTYVVEDLQTSYWVQYGGSPKGRGHGTSMEFFLSLANGLNYEEFDLALYSPSTFDREIVSVNFYHNLVFVHKGRNEEGSSELPPHPRAARYFGRALGAKARIVARSERDDWFGRSLRFALGVRRSIRQGCR